MLVLACRVVEMQEPFAAILSNTIDPKGLMQGSLLIQSFCALLCPPTPHANAPLHLLSPTIHRQLAAQEELALRPCVPRTRANDIWADPPKWMGSKRWTPFPHGGNALRDRQSRAIFFFKPLSFDLNMMQYTGMTHDTGVGKHVH